MYESNRALEREYKSCEPKRNEVEEWGEAARFFSPSRVRRNNIMAVGTTHCPVKKVVVSLCRFSRSRYTLLTRTSLPLPRSKGLKPRRHSLTALKK